MKTIPDRFTEKKNTRITILKNRPEVIVCLLLTVLIFSAYGRILCHEFVILDDKVYVTEAPHVRAGLSRAGIRRAFTTFHANFYHPLTTLSHMLDCHLYGLKPGMHHLTSLLLHTANSLLLFLLFRRMTHSLWPSAVVAYLFALHPLHVESVAWVSERKDVLSAFFWILAMWAYARYVDKPGMWRYALLLLLFAMGLMAKPMVVTLPFVLLLMDYWPLYRRQWSRQGIRLFLRPVWEKLPLFALAALACVLAVSAQEKGAAITSLEEIPFIWRIGNALVSYVSYLGKTFWPFNLAAYYHYRGLMPLWQPIFAGIALTSLSVLLLKGAKNSPAPIVGWLWYLGTLVPVIGLAQVGYHAMADRYTYVPLIGVFVAIAWGGSALAVRWQRGKTGLIAVAVVVFSALPVVTFFQAGYWKDSITLYEHILDVRPGNYFIHGYLGHELGRMGRRDEAIRHFHEAIRLNPQYADAYTGLGKAMEEKGNTDQAIQYYKKALDLNPDLTGAHFNMGVVLVNQGRMEEAVSHYWEAIRLKADHVEARVNLGIVLQNLGRIDEAIEHLVEAVRLKPNDAEPRINMGVALFHKGDMEGAIAQFQEAVRISPNNRVARENLNNLLMHYRRYPRDKDAP